jgi:hypothetical protein
MKITLAQANAIASKVNREIRKASYGEIRDALYRGEETPRWALDAGEFAATKTFTTVAEALSHVVRKNYEALSQAGLTDRQRNMVEESL